jgi:hypothetical protein
MAGKAGSVDPSRSDPLLDDHRHGFTGQPLQSDAAMPVDRPEDSAGLDRRNGEPPVKGEHGAMAGSAEGDADLSSFAHLIDLRPAQRDDHSLPDALDVGAVKADQFRSSEPARVPHRMLTLP